MGISVLAEPPLSESGVLEDARSVLAGEEIPLVLRASMPELVENFRTLVGAPAA